MFAKSSVFLFIFVTRFEGLTYCNFDLNVRILTKQQQNLLVKTGKTDCNIYVNRQASSWNMSVKWLYDTMLLLFHM